MKIYYNSTYPSQSKLKKKVHDKGTFTYIFKDNIKFGMYTHIWGPKGSLWSRDQTSLKSIFVFLKYIGRSSVIQFQFASVTFQIKTSQSENLRYANQST